MSFNAVYYGVLLLNHTFRIDGLCSIVKLIINLSGSSDSNTVFRKLRYFTHLTLQSVTPQRLYSLGFYERFYVFNGF